MFNKKLIKIVVVCVLLFIISFSLVSGAYADDSVNGSEKSKVKGPIPIKFTSTDLDDDDEDDDFNAFDDDSGDDEGDDEDDSDDSDDENSDDSDDEDSDDSDDDSPNYREFEWKGNIYYIDLDQFNLTDEELIELFTKRDALMEEIDNLEFLIHEMELSRNNDTLLAIDNLYDAINNITNNTEFNDLLLSLKDINIIELNSTFNELKTLLELIKAENPNEDFTEVDSLMAALEALINEDLLKYETLNAQLREKLAELYELFDKYPFLRQHTKYLYSIISDISYAGSGKVLEGDGPEKDSNITSSINASAEMKNTGIPYFSLVTLLLLLGLIGYKRKF